MSTDQHPEGADSAFASAAGVAFAGSVQGAAATAAHSRLKVPDAIERRYLHVDDRFFFPDRTLAFIDEGDRIRVRTENREVLHSVVAISEARGWRVIELKGTASFRQGIWREASLRGIEARGYEPTEAEILQVQRALKKWHPSHEFGQGSGPQSASAHREAKTQPGEATPAEPGSNAGGHPPDGAPNGRSLREGPRPPVRGMLVAAAAAPYRFDPAQRMSFYVTVRTEVGERSIWGADLERALAESVSRPGIGDQVVLTQHGSHSVRLRVTARNSEGELVGEKKIVAQRARWSIETPDHLRARGRRAELVRTGELLSDAALARQPELVTAAACLQLAEQYARRVTTDESSQQRLVQLIRERMADALAQGHSIHLPDRRMHPTPMQVRQRSGRAREESSHERF
ncbi:LPD7 domain-containing protein [Variovorax sp. DT-64]|uniref:LPD7 domain-containing protein n=1 Tax=Variovorax sp. DT-64 TaxID=3396160 RepID=UPI003F1CC4A2